MSNTEEDSSHDEVPDLPTGISEDSLYETYTDDATGVLVPKHFETFEQYVVVELLRERREDEINKREYNERQYKLLMENIVTPLANRLIPDLINALTSRSVAVGVHPIPPHSGPVPS